MVLKIICDVCGKDIVEGTEDNIVTINDIIREKQIMGIYKCNDCKSTMYNITKILSNNNSDVIATIEKLNVIVVEAKKQDIKDPALLKKYIDDKIALKADTIDEVVIEEPIEEELPPVDDIPPVEIPPIEEPPVDEEPPIEEDPPVIEEPPVEEPPIKTPKEEILKDPVAEIKP